MNFTFLRTGLPFNVTVGLSIKKSTLNRVFVLASEPRVLAYGHVTCARAKCLIFHFLNRLTSLRA
jgi:hypothetical protein